MKKELERNRIIIIIIIILVIIGFGLYFLAKDVLLSPEEAVVKRDIFSNCPGDINNDGRVNAWDLIRVRLNYGKSCIEPNWCGGIDFNKDGNVDANDLSVVRKNFGTKCNKKQVKLTIDSNKKAIAIKEGISEEWEISDYSISPEFEIFRFKASENTWIIADKNKEIAGELTYIVTPKVKSVIGEYYFVAGIEEAWCYGTDANKDTNVDANDLAFIRKNFGKCSEVCEGDVNKDKGIDSLDLRQVRRNFGNEGCVAEGSLMKEAIG